MNCDSDVRTDALHQRLLGLNSTDRGRTVELLEALMEADRLQLHDRTERGWTPPPKGYTKGLES